MGAAVSHPESEAASGDSVGAFGRASYKAISLYSPNRAPCRIDLSDNTNMWGVPPAARRVIEEASGSLITRYLALIHI